MRCHPLRWLWGLLPLAVWTWVTVLSERPRIEADLAKRTLETLKSAGFDWATVSFSGRDGTILGKAVEDSEPTAALRVANNNVWGVRIADAQTDLIEKVDTYLWSAAITDDNTVRLSGYVPNEAARRSVVAAVKGDFPKATIEDRMRLARGAPDQAAWLGGIKFAAKQLTGLRRGHVDLSGTELSVTGEAQSTSTYGNIKSALKSSLPQGIKLASDRVTPPVVSPYLWSAQHSGDHVVVAGYVPSEKVRDDILAHARKVHGKVTDKLQLAEGAPEGMQKAALASLDQLAFLKKGTVELKGHQITLSGNAADEDTAEGVRRAWRTAVPAAFKTSDQLTFPKPEPKPEPPAVKPVDNTAQLEAEAAAERQRQAEAAAAAERQRQADAAAAADRQRQAEAAAAAERQRQAEAAAAAERQRQADAAAAAERQRQAEAAAAAEAKRRAEEAEAQRVAAATEARRAEARKCETALRTVSREGIIRFDRASADLHSDSTSTLDKLAKAVNACPGYVVEIEGHTDAEGTPERNKRLSERRAQSIVAFLTRAGVSADRLNAVGYGETRPVAPNDTPENRAKNRRIEFTVKDN